MSIEIGFMERRREQLLADLLRLKNRVPRDLWQTTNGLVERVEELLSDSLNFCRTLSNSRRSINPSKHATFPPGLS